MKKKILLVMCIAVLAAALCVGVAAFTDIEDETTENAVATLNGMGIVSGTSATKYSPNLTLTRAQVCAMMIRTKGLDSSAESYANKNLFSDVKSGAWYTGYVNLAYKEGIISGYGNGKFGPDDEITYGQFVTMLIRLLGYTESDVGKMWPADYVVFADKLDISDDVNLAANDKVSRADAAILLYNTLMSNAKGASTPYYRTVSGAASTVTAIVLDNNVSGSTTGDLLVYVISSTGASMKYYYQENKVSDTFVGSLGTLLLNSSGKAVGFISDGNDYTDIIVDSAKVSGITDTSGNTYKISGTASVISEGSVYTYNQTGYVKVNSHSGQSARFYFADDGTVSYIYLTSGTDASTTATAVAVTETPAAEFEEAFGIGNRQYYIVKNGGLTDTAALAMYDTAYFDEMTNTLRVSDYKITGYIEYASPSVSAAETITVSGCEISVLQSAWDTLGSFKLGSYVTLLLTDNGCVAAAYPSETVTAEMYGVLSVDGGSIVLCGSGLTMKPSDISANIACNGSLVKVNTSSDEKVTCTAVSKKISKTDSVDVVNKTVGGVRLAPGCAVYEWGGSGYIYSLSGEQGKFSTDLSEIYWTEELDYSYVSFYHTNSIGLVDILVLKDATGNYYQYGLLTSYKDEKGIAVGKIYMNGLTITNDVYPNESRKYITTGSSAGGYAGISLAAYSNSNTKIGSISRPTVSKTTTVTDFYLNSDDEWYVKISDTSIPVSDNVKVYVKPTRKWYSGEEGLLTALSSELQMNVYYDRTLSTGAQVRIIVVDGE